MTRSSSGRCDTSFVRKSMSFWICFSILISWSFSLMEIILLRLASNSLIFDGPSDVVDFPPLALLLSLPLKK
ncbi:hypothetical protein HanRHA438_Chr01g0031221 [Helianthus annuus]|nr:hypothetical protein HanRHA438_Chr01g0031221 [Helianthus annuus]